MKNIFTTLQLDGRLNPKLLLTRRRISVILCAATVVVVVGATYFFVPNISTHPLLSPSFKPLPLAESTSKERLLHIALERLLSVKEISYDVSAHDTYNGHAALKLTPGAREMATSTTFLQGPFSVDFLQKTKDFYIRYNKMPVKDDPRSKYLDKWILANDETTQGISSGSEFGFMILAAASSMDAPFLVGNLSSQAKDGALSKIKGGLYKIESAQLAKYQGADAVKYSLRVNYEDMAKFFAEIVDEKIDTSSEFVIPGYAMFAPAYGGADEYDTSKDTINLWVSPVNGQVFEMSRYIDSDQAAFSSRTVTYKNIRFDGVKMPATPAETIPYNVFSADR